MRNHATIEAREPALCAIDIIQATPGGGRFQGVCAETESPDGLGEYRVRIHEFTQDRKEIRQGVGFFAQITYRFADRRQVVLAEICEE